MAVAAVAALLTPAGARSQPLQLREALSYSFASGLVAAPGGGRVAWVELKEGVRNVWVAAAPEWRGRAVTAYGDDDGQEIASLAFTPDGARLLFVRGGAPNRQGEVPDPISTPDAETRAVWIVPAGGGEPRRVVEAGGFSMHPGGERIAYTRGREIWEVGLDEGAEPHRLARVRGNPGTLRWSPDGSRLAFVSNRGDHAFIGVLTPGGDVVRYLDPSVHRDGAPVWSPDGSRIAFLRVPNQRRLLPFAPRRSGLPFSLRIADAASGEGHEVWRAAEGRGSVFSGVGADDQILWLDDHLVFPWERDGWKHLWAVPVTGGEARLLTPGAFEVQFVRPGGDGRSVLYDSNQGDIDRKHVWRVDVRGGAPRALTTGEGIEWGAVDAGGGATVLLASDARTPAHVEVQPAGGGRRANGPAQPASFPGASLVVPQQVIFRAADGMRIHGQLFLPPGHREGERHPAVLFFHGGSRRQMLLGFHHRGYYHNAYAMNQVLASRGYVVLSVNYRSGIGYGMEFREALNYGAAGASEFNDVLGAGLYLQSRSDVDPDRIGLWGGSYGGYLTALGLARASDLFAAGVDLHGVHDWNVVIRNFVPTYDAGAREAFSRLAYESSPMASIDGWRSPVLLIHGDDDRNVPFSESVDLAEALAVRGVPFEQLVFPDEVHGFLLHRNWVAAYEAALSFFDRHLAHAEDRP